MRKIKINLKEGKVGGGGRAFWANGMNTRGHRRLVTHRED